MQNLSTTLLAAQKGSSVIPAVACGIDDRHVGASRYRWSVFQSSADASGPNAMARATNGAYLVRAWVDASGNLKISRAAALGGQFGAWTTIATGVETTAQIALAGLDRDDRGDCVWVVYFATTGDFYARLSVDGGVTWGAAQHIGDVGVGNDWVVNCAGIGLAACGNGTADVMGMVAVHDTHYGARLISLVHKKAAGTWLAGIVKTIDCSHRAQSVAKARGCACFPSGQGTNGKIMVMYAGPWSQTVISSLQRLGLAYNPSGDVVTLSEWGASLTSQLDTFYWQWPAPLTKQLTDGRSVCAVVEHSALSVRINYFSIYPLANSEEFTTSDLVPVDVTTAIVDADGFGWSGVYNPDLGTQYFGNSRAIWTSYFWSVSEWVPVGVSPPRWDAALVIRGYNSQQSHRLGGRLVLVLDNSSGALDGLFKRGMQVSLHNGCVGTVGAEYNLNGPLWWIERITYSMGGKLTLICYDALGKLARMQARQYQEWRDVSPSKVLQEAVRRFGFVYSDDGSASLTDTTTGRQPFKITPGGSWLDLVNDVLDYSGTEIVAYAGAAAGSAYVGPPIIVVKTLPTTSTYTYGPGASEHPIASGEYGDVDSAETWVHVTGASGTDLGEAVDQTLIDELGFSSDRSIVDGRIRSTTIVTPALRAAYALAQSKRARRFGTLVAGMNCGQDMLDAVTVHDGRYSCVNRVMGLTRIYDPDGAVFQNRLLLGDL